MKFKNIIKIIIELLSRIYFQKPTVEKPKPVSKKNKTINKYVKTVPAPRINPYVEAIKSAISAKIGLPYIYGGDLDKVNFQEYGLDCSGFVLRCFQDVGVMWEAYDNNCAGIYKELLDEGQQIISYRPSAHTPIITSFAKDKSITFSDDKKTSLKTMFELKKSIGSYAFLHSIFLIFYGKVGDRLSHVAFWYNHALIAEAGGGGQACREREDALKLKDAKVRFSPYNCRPTEIRDIVQIDFRNDYVNL